MTANKIYFNDMFLDDSISFEEIQEMKLRREREIFDMDSTQTKKAISIFFGSKSGKFHDESYPDANHCSVSDLDTFYKWCDTFFEEVDMNLCDYIECDDPEWND